MRKKLVFLVLTVFMISLASAIQIAEDDFECGGNSCGSGWSGAWGFSGVECEITGLGGAIGSFHLRGDAGCNATRNFDNSAYADVNLTLWATAQSLEDGDFCYYSYFNGSAYFELFNLTNGDDDTNHDFYSFNVTQYGFASNAGINMQAPPNGADYCAIDNINITGLVTSQSDSEYPMFSSFLDNNATLVDNGVALFNVTVTSTNGTVFLEIDGANYSASNLTASVYNISVSLTAGVYDYYWGSWGNGTATNYNISNLRSYTVNASADNEYPQFLAFVEEPNNGTTYIFGATYEFNVTVENTNGTVGLEFNGTNYTAMNLTASAYNVSIGGLAAGAYQYYWFSWGNGTAMNYNISNLRSYTVAKAVPQGSISGTSTITYGTMGDVQGSESNSGDVDVIYTLFRNNVTVSNPDTTTLGVGSYNYVYNASGGTNYTDNSSIVTLTLTVNQAQSLVNLTLNGTEGNITIAQGETILLNGTLIAGDSFGRLLLYSNGTLINNATTEASNLTTFNEEGLFNITVEYEGSQNYSLGFETYFVNVTGVINNAPNVSLNSPQNNSVLNQTFAILNVSVFDSDLNNMTVWFYGNNIELNVSYNVTNGTSLLYNWSNLNNGNYNWSAVAFDGNENSAQEHGVFTINKTSGKVPSIEIAYPSYASVYNSNESIQLNFSVIGSNIDSCWYIADGGTNTSLPDCVNSTFNVSGEGIFNLSVYANETVEGKVGADNVKFYIALNKPSIHLVLPKHKKYTNVPEVAFSQIPSSTDVVSSCSLFGDFNGNFGLNQTLNVTEDVENTFDLNLSEGIYSWAVSCSDSNSSFAITGNRTLSVDTNAPNVSIVGEPVNNSEIVGDVDFEYNISDLTPTTCTFQINVTSSGEVAYSNVSTCNNILIKYRVSLPVGSYRSEFRAVDSAGNVEVTPIIFFAVAAPPSNGDSPNGGGSSDGGDGSGGAIILLGEPDIEIISEGDYNFKRGEATSLVVEVVNNGGKFANGCSVFFSGEASDWISSSDANEQSIGAGEQVAFGFSADVPSSIATGNYDLVATASCIETSATKIFNANVFVNDFEVEIIDYERVNNNLRIFYTLEEFAERYHDITIDYMLLDFDGLTRFNSQESVFLAAGGSINGLIEFDLPKDSFGEFNFIMALSDGLVSIRAEREIFLPSGVGTGLAISDENRRTLSILGFIVAAALVLFFVVRFIYDHHKRLKKITHKRRKRKLIELDL